MFHGVDLQSIPPNPVKVKLLIYFMGLIDHATWRERPA